MSTLSIYKNFVLFSKSFFITAVIGASSYIGWAKVPDSSAPAKRSIIVISDLEPDDRIALHVLAANFDKSEIGFVGSTVMNSERKRVLIERLLRQVGLADIAVYQGSGGSADTYPDIASSRAARTYENEGKGILTARELAQLEKVPLSGTPFQVHLVDYLSKHTNVEVVLLAPPTDLIAVLEDHPELQSHIGVIHVMGGWSATKDTNGNETLRTTYNWNMDPDASQKLMRLKDVPIKLYSSHVIKQTFAGGSINASSFPDLMGLLNQASSFLSSLREGTKASSSWDHHLMDQIPALKKVIGEHVGKQFTPADPLVLVGMTTPALIAKARAVSVEIDVTDEDSARGFQVKVETDEDSKITLIEEIDMAIFESAMLQAFSQLITKVNTELAVTYFTDPEGNWKKFEDFLSHSEGFFKGSDGKFHLQPDSHFVFGGDAPDRGPGTMRIIGELLRLKKESGERVVFIAGNRDANKVRIPVEVATESATKKVEKLQYIFAKTMGAPKAFEFRRAELAELQGKKLADISDDAVVASFLDELSPSGKFTQFLEQSQLAHRIGNTLFVHAGVTEQSLGRIPGQETKVGDVNKWIGQLNRWYRGQIDSWKKGLGEKPGFQFAEELVNYSKPASGQKDNPASVVYGRNNDRFNNPNLPLNEVIQKLLQVGIQRIVLGHTPTGETPVILRKDDEFEVISADNSYAANEDSAHQVTLKGDQLDTAFIASRPRSIAGTTELRAFTRLGTSSPIGKRLADGSIVVAPTRDGYLAVKLTEGFRAVYTALSYQDVRLRGATNPVPENGSVRATW